MIAREPYKGALPLDEALDRGRRGHKYAGRQYIIRAPRGGHYTSSRLPRSAAIEGVVVAAFTSTGEPAPFRAPTIRCRCDYMTKPVPGFGTPERVRVLGRAKGLDGYFVVRLPEGGRLCFHSTHLDASCPVA